MGKSLISLRKHSLLTKIVSLFKNNFLFVLVLVLAIFLRVFRLSELTTFGGDQGQDFLVVKDMVLYHKWTLLGIKTSVYSFFQGPMYLYMLFPFFVLFNLNPISGAIAAVFYSVITLIFLYILVNKYFSKRVAVLSSLLFAVSGELIIYGNTPLYQHFLPLVIILSIYLLLVKKKNTFISIVLGLSIGLGIELHLLNLSLLIAVFFYLVFIEKSKLKNILSFIVGFIVGLAPTIIFELRHDFLNTRFLLNYQPKEEFKILVPNFINQWIKGSAIFLGGNSIIIGIIILVFIFCFLFTKQKHPNLIILKRLLIILSFVSLLLCLGFSAYEPHYLLPIWITLLILIPAAIENIFNKKIGSLLIFVLILFNLAFSVGRFNNNHGYSMPDGWNLKKIDIAGKIISKDSLNHPNFNVASLLDSVMRAFPIRYVVEVNGSMPESVESYPSNNYLYVVSRYNHNDMFEVTTWEVTSFYPFEIGKTWDLNDGIYLYRLDRIRF